MLFLEKFFDDFDLENTCASIEFESTVTFLDDEYTTEGVAEFGNAIKRFFEKIIEAIKNAVNGAIEKVQAMIKKHNLKTAVKDLKVELMNHKEAIQGKTVEIQDTKKYIDAYTKYVDTFNSEIHALYDKPWPSYSSFDKARRAFQDKMKKLEDDLDIGNNEKYMMKVEIIKGIENLEADIQNFGTLGYSLEKIWVSVVNKCRTLAEKFLSIFKKKSEEKAKVQESEGDNPPTEHELALKLQADTSTMSTKVNSYVKKLIQTPMAKAAAIKGITSALISGAMYYTGYRLSKHGGKYNPLKVPGGMLKTAGKTYAAVAAANTVSRLASAPMQLEQIENMTKERIASLEAECEKKVAKAKEKHAKKIAELQKSDAPNKTVLLAAEKERLNGEVTKIQYAYKAKIAEAKTKVTNKVNRQYTDTDVATKMAAGLGGPAVGLGVGMLGKMV